MRDFGLQGGVAPIGRYGLMPVELCNPAVLESCVPCILQ